MPSSCIIHPAKLSPSLSSELFCKLWSVSSVSKCVIRVNISKNSQIVTTMLQQRAGKSVGKIWILTVKTVKVLWLFFYINFFWDYCLITFKRIQEGLAQKRELHLILANLMRCLCKGSLLLGTYLYRACMLLQLEPICLVVIQCCEFINYFYFHLFITTERVTKNCFLFWHLILVAVYFWKFHFNVKLIKT